MSQIEGPSQGSRDVARCCLCPPRRFWATRYTDCLTSSLNEWDNESIGTYTDCEITGIRHENVVQEKQDAKQDADSLLREGLLEESKIWAVPASLSMTVGFGALLAGPVELGEVYKEIYLFLVLGSALMSFHVVVVSAYDVFFWASMSPAHCAAFVACSTNRTSLDRGFSTLNPASLFPTAMLCQVAAVLVFVAGSDTATDGEVGVVVFWAFFFMYAFLRHHMLWYGQNGRFAWYVKQRYDDYNNRR